MTDRSKNIVIETVPGAHIENHHTEVVERKGLGHPDSLADGISEAISRALSQRYLEEFGQVAHHNTDEVQIIGGQSQPQCGGGTMLQPIYILLGGRAAQMLDDTAINVHGIAKQAATDYLDDTVRHLDVDKDVIIDSRIGEGSSDLTQLYGQDGGAPLANDTSFGVGHAPFSATEKLVLAVEERLNAAATKEQYPFIGEDVKVMANRQDDRVDVTVAVAFVDRYVDSYDDYMAKKEQVTELVEATARDHTDRDVNVAVNTADGDSDDEIYLTVTGTSAEMGDDGSVGRGNRVSGLITPRRAMSLEASSGKNPVAHIGKIYNLMAHRVAEDIVDAAGSVDEAHVVLLSQIGQPINDPQVANIQIASASGLTQDDERRIGEITDSWLERFDELMEQIINGDVRTF
jgi:S-adenosylmethionine synthetase